MPQRPAAALMPSPWRDAATTVTAQADRQGHGGPRPMAPAPPPPGGASPSSVGATASGGGNGSAPGAGWIALLVAFGLGTCGLYKLLLASSGWHPAGFVSLLERPG
jgi:hypothetical protein